MFEFRRNETAYFIRPLDVVDFVFLLEKSFYEPLYHRDVIAHYLFYADWVIVNVAYLFPEVPDNVKVLWNDAARSDLLNTEDKNAKEGMFDSHIVCTQKTLLANS